MHTYYPSSHRVINIISMPPIIGRELVIGSGSLTVHCWHLASTKEKASQISG
jgi:hypothetical protein